MSDETPREDASSEEEEEEAVGGRSLPLSVLVVERVVELGSSVESAGKATMSTGEDPKAIKSDNQRA